MVLGVTRVGATQTKAIIEEFRARKAAAGAVAAGARSAARPA